VVSSKPRSGENSFTAAFRSSSFPSYSALPSPELQLSPRSSERRTILLSSSPLRTAQAYLFTVMLTTAPPCSQQ